MFMPWFIDVCMHTAPLHAESARKNPLSSKLLAKSFMSKNPETTDHGPKTIGHGLTIAAVAAKVATPEVGTLPSQELCRRMELVRVLLEFRWI